MANLALLGIGLGPKSWSRSPGRVVFLSGVIVASTLLGSEGLGLYFCAGFTFSSGVHTLVRSWIKVGGLVPHY